MILMNDFTAESRQTRKATMQAVERVLESGWYILGDEVTAFERSWADACGVRHAVGVGNGMDAIEIILEALDLGPGDEVITTPMKAFASVLAILRDGATPVLADIDPHTALLSLESVERCVTARTKAVLVVHLYGQVRDMSAWQRLCDGHGIALVEDCAQAHLAGVNGKTAGAFGRAGAYSFYPTKNLGAIGDAGAIVTDDADLASRASRLRNYGQSVRYHHPECGLNSRLDELQAAILRVRLEHLAEWTATRQRAAAAYFEGIANPAVQLLSKPEVAGAHVYHLFVITCGEREALQAHLAAAGVQSLIHYPVPIHHQKSVAGIRRDPMGLAASERHAATCLSIPCHPMMTDHDLQFVIDAINAFGR